MPAGLRHTRTLSYIAEIARSGSIRRAAERMNITPSALTRQVQDLEYELGTPLFERLQQGMRLNAAGELLVRHIRDQMADLERVRSQIADLKGMRRGHITLACSQAFATSVIPHEIETYRNQFPDVTFAVQVMDHEAAIQRVIDLEADIALVISPPFSAEIQIIYNFTQTICAIMSKDHELASTDGPVRLRECLNYPVALPDKSVVVRHQLDQYFATKGIMLRAAIESNSMDFLRTVALRQDVIAMQMLTNMPDDDRLRCRTIDERDLKPVPSVLCQLRGRVLPIAAAKFADGLIHRLQDLA
jgi:DNA-binding transcriptional LysR family regulator